MTQLSLLTEPRYRADNSSTSVAAARRVAASAGETQFLILGAFEAHGPLTDNELCRALDVDPLRWPTIKTARSRCKNAGWLIPTGEVRDGQQVWTLA